MWEISTLEAPFTGIISTGSVRVTYSEGAARSCKDKFTFPSGSTFSEVQYSGSSADYSARYAAAQAQCKGTDVSQVEWVRVLITSVDRGVSESPAKQRATSNHTETAINRNNIVLSYCEREQA